MFSFFKRKKTTADQSPESTPQQDAAESDVSVPEGATDDNERQRSESLAETSADKGPVANDAPARPQQEEPDVVEQVPAAQVPGADEVSAAQETSPEHVAPADGAQTELSAANQVPPDSSPTAAVAAASAVDAEDTTNATKTTDVTAEHAADASPTPTSTQESNGKRGSWFARLKRGLSRTGQSIGGLFVDVKLDEDLYEELETALIMADAGMEATTSLLEALRNRVRKDRLTDAMQARAALRELITEHLKPLEKEFPLGSAKPLVMMIAGVNGAGKTTSIGKLANAFQERGAHVLLAAGDTFRAAAREQLMEWGSRNNVTVIAQEGGDPAAVAFDAVNAGRARKADVVMVDTAGRLPTQLHLMEELKKIRRVINKAEGSAPHEVLLVVDGNSGQNVLAQIRAFDAAIGLTGLVVTKLDGTAKGGILAAVAAGSQGVRPVPVYWIGVGEGIHDLQPFRAHEFAAALIGDGPTEDATNAQG